MSVTYVNIDTTIGALQIGSIVAVFLFGIITLQAHIYFTSFPDDRWGFKALVAVVWILEMMHTAGVNYQVYYSAITLAGEPQQLMRFPMLGGVVAIGGFITLLAQGFSALRLYTILPKPYSHIGVFCIFFSFARCVASFYLAVQAILTTDAIEYIIQWNWLISTLLAGGAAVDMIIAVSMLYYLSRKRGRTPERATRLIDYLIIYTIRTGLLTSASAVILLICFKTMPFNFIWMAIYVSLAKLYSNSLYSTLNSRKKMRRNIQNLPSVDPSISRRRSVLRKSGQTFRIAPISIELNTVTETTHDIFHDKSGGYHHQFTTQLTGDPKI